MKEPWQWQEEDIQTLVQEQRKESLALEYKRSDALAKTENNKKEISKDVSAMANSAGGTIIYGIDEQKKSNGQIQLDGGVAPQEISTEWLEQVIDSNVHRRIANLRVHSVKMGSTGKCVYVVWIPQSNWAPHIAADHRYYKRLGTTTAMMEEYEVRDVGHRSDSPDLHLDLDVKQGGGGVYFQPRISNHSSEPVLYATFRLYVQGPPYLQGNVDWTRIANVEMIWNDSERISFQVVRHSWSVHQRHAILEGEEYPLGQVFVDFKIDPKVPGIPRGCKIGWELRTPKAAPKLCGLWLWVVGPTASIDGQIYHLTPP
ncbi:MAG: ATP-binding protein [Bryobacteraceae bacterium]|jgi:hypothetical protein